MQFWLKSLAAYSEKLLGSGAPPTILRKLRAVYVESHCDESNVAVVWRVFFIFNYGFDLFDLSSVRVPGPVPHPGFPKQQFTGNLGLFLGGSGAGLPCPVPGSRGSRAGIQNIYF